MSAQDGASTAAAHDTEPAPTSMEGDTEASTATVTSSTPFLDHTRPPKPRFAGTSHDSLSVTAECHPHGATTTVTTPANLEEDGAQSPKTSRFAWFKRMFSDNWVPEIAAIVFSILCLIAVVITLAVFDNNPRPQLTRHITFNAIVSILATGTRSSLTYATASILGQKKWTWFMSGPRRLHDVQTLDEASRGPLGSFKMLFGRVAASTASLGALITIFALAFDPFVQQLIDYPTNPMVVPSANASVRRATFVPDLSRVQVPHFTGVEDAVALGTFSNNFLRKPICPSRNCTWPSVHSVSWCSKCEDITSQDRVIDCDPPFNWNSSAYSEGTAKLTECKISLPDFEPVSVVINATSMGSMKFCDPETCQSGTQLDMSATYQIISTLFPLKETGSDVTNTTPEFDMQQRMVLQMGEILLQPDSRGPGFSVNKALKCGVSPCLNTYSISVQDAQEHTRLVDSKWYQSGLRNLTAFSEDMSASPLNAATCFELDDAPKNYSKVSSWISTTPSFVDTEHDSFCIYSWVHPEYVANYNWASPLDAWVDPIAQATSATASVEWTWWFNGSTVSTPTLVGSFDPDTSSGSYVEHILYQGGFDSVLTNITESLTVLNLAYSTETVSGSLVEQAVFVHVRWRWITLPAILVTAAAIALILAMLETRSDGAELWKDSTLALLYHGIDESVIDGQKLYSKSGDFDEAAKEVDVQLKRDTDSGRLMLRRRHRADKA